MKGMTEPMSTGTASADDPKKCRFPGCGKPVPARVPGKGGRDSRYCGETDENGIVHDRINYFRFGKDKSDAAEDEGLTSGGVPYTTAKTRTQHQTDQLEAIAANMIKVAADLKQTVAVIADPENAGAEMRTYERRAQNAQHDAEAAIEQAEAAAAAAEQALEERNEARDLAAELEGRIAAAAREHAEQLREEATRHATELDEAHRDADARVQAAKTAAEARIAELKEAHAGDLTQVRDEATQQVTAAHSERNAAVTRASVAEEATARAREDASAANGRAEQAAAEAVRVRETYERQVTQLRDDAARDRDQAAAQLAQVKAAADRDREQLEVQVEDLRGRAGQLTLEVERGRETAAADREQMRTLYEGRISDLATARQSEGRRADTAETRLQEALTELRRLRENDRPADSGS